MPKITLAKAKPGTLKEERRVQEVALSQFRWLTAREFLEHDGVIYRKAEANETDATYLSIHPTTVFGFREETDT